MCTARSIHYQLVQRHCATSHVVEGHSKQLTRSSSLMALTAFTKARQSQWEGQACTMKRAVWMGDMMRFTSTQLNCSTVRCSRFRFSCSRKIAAHQQHSIPEDALSIPRACQCERAETQTPKPQKTRAFPTAAASQKKLDTVLKKPNAYQDRYLIIFGFCVP